VNGRRTTQISEGDEAELVVPQTTFYAESGGQLGDRGMIEDPCGLFQVLDTQYGSGEVIIHKGRVLHGELGEGNEVLLRVDRAQRLATARNHSATHLLQYALRQYLGDHVKQSGSLVAPDRFRFDFTHFSAVGEEELHQVEALVNEKIRENDPVDIRYMSFQSARQQKAIALFGEKYGETVRVVQMGDFSRELCGGTHIHRTGDIGLFTILHESSVAAGVRRIEALTGEAAFRYLKELEKEYKHVTLLLQTRSGELVSKLERLLERQKVLEKQIESHKTESINEITTRVLAQSREMGRLRVVASEVNEDVPTLRKISDQLRDHIHRGVVLLGSQNQGKAVLILAVTKDLTTSLNAGELIRELAKEIGGSGGGRPDMAQAGGPWTDKLPQAFRRLEELLKAFYS
jgi:alanyl-tRNA synthetase